MSRLKGPAEKGLRTRVEVTPFRSQDTGNRQESTTEAKDH